MIDLNIIEMIVNDVINDDVVENIKLVEVFEEEEEFTDPERDIKNTLTDFVNDYFLKYDDNIFKLLKIIFTAFIEGIDDYKKKMKLDHRDIIFSYKGGNVLRIINNNIIKILPANAHNLINKEYSKYLKQSDNDFGIFVNPNLKNYDKIFNDISLLSYLLLDYIRSIYEKNAGEFFYFCGLNKRMQNKAIKELLKMLQALPNRNIKTVNFFKRPDGLIDFLNNKRALYEINGNKKSVFYTTLNKTLDFQAGKLRTRFDLARTKLSFLIDNLTLSSGELIDVSVSHRDDTYVKKYNTNKKFRDFIDKNIIMNLYNEEYEFTYNLISLGYIIEDLNIILFKQANLPWDKPKYKKRLNRLMYFILLDSLNENVINGKSLKVLYNELGDLSDTLFDNKKAKFKNKRLKEFYNNTKEMIDRFSRERNEDEEQLKDYFETTKINIFVLRRIVNKLIEFMESFVFNYDIYEIDEVT